MRWPNRHPHQLTPGRRAAQAALARFLPLIDWQHYRRRNLNDELSATEGDPALFGSGDKEQAVVWLLRKDTLGADGRLRQDAAPLHTTLRCQACGPATIASQPGIPAWELQPTSSRCATTARGISAYRCLPW